METVLCSIPDAAMALGLGRSKTYELIDEGRLQTVRIGRRRLVVVSSIHRLAEKTAPVAEPYEALGAPANCGPA